MSRKVLVTGGNGQVGSEIFALQAEYSQYKFIFTDVESLDITNKVAIFDFFDKNELAYCINTAAYTAVDQAEADVDRAYLVNATAVGYLAEACARYQTVFIHLSTDYVYHNSQNIPFKEDDKTNPQNVYAASKLRGDEFALTHCSNTIIFRTSWVYSSFGKNFVKTMLRLGKERTELRVIFDQIGTPTYAHDLAKTILDVVTKIETGSYESEKISGVYHYSNEGVASWYDFAVAIFDIASISCTVLPIETKDYPTPAKRPPFSLLNKQKIKETFGISIPYWRESLKNCLLKLEF